MLRGGVVLVTALFSVVFLKKRLQLFHYLGCGLVFSGVCLVGAANFIFKDDNSTVDVKKFSY
jgi:drug/metabolite transporter (DMT)-like permease